MKEFREMRVNVIKNGVLKCYETNASLSFLEHHFNTERDTDLKQYVEKEGYAFNLVKPIATLNYDENLK